MMQLDIRTRTKKIRLRFPVFLGLRLHPKTSDSATLLSKPWCWRGLTINGRFKWSDKNLKANIRQVRNIAQQRGRKKPLPKVCWWTGVISGRVKLTATNWKIGMVRGIAERNGIGYRLVQATDHASNGMVWFNHAFLWLKSRNNTKQQEEIQ